ncbi:MULTISPECIES: transglutaminase-like domain-containing protein [unclassified Acidovorax]|uniref:transglutaminase-like domain-containing protein n=1 Tax=unclassified Acidovorax TaxID=2684926 RepID=UPI001C484738|nr:transglutaminase-like domain-containing protein [Acidovorax sp. sif0732]MBV7448890.1 transglutaminase-like domain-containing protein [Acidovorax sp. sif0715]
MQQRLQSGAPAEQYADTLEQLARALNPESGTPGIAATFTDAASSLPAVQTLDRQAQALQQEWESLRNTWQNAGVEGSVLDRQLAQEAAFADKHEQLVKRLQAVQEGSSNGKAAALQVLKEFIDTEAPGKTHLPLNLNKLPWQAERARPQAPIQMDGPEAEQPPSAAKAATVQSAKAASAPSAADLAPTLDAPHTDAIKALAQTLGHNPHKIYQWVHDNIHYVPTQGSVQGAQDTLDKKSGNAVDTASLLVALLRASGIPARYVAGTVDIPTAQALNWVGGVRTVDAAQQIWGQGGVSNVALVSGGQIKALRIEHTWVEALIQYQPGRGTRHTPGQSTPDTWVPLDGSFKQYTFKEGMDLQSAVPLDAQALLNAAQQGAETNPAEGWVRNLNTSALQSQLGSYQARLKTYIDSQNAGQSTVGDVLGTRQASIDPLPYLAGTLPYNIKTRSQTHSDLPTSSKTHFKYEIYADARSAAWGDNPLLSWQTPTAAIAGKKITLAWVAASAADEAAIAALIPKPAPGQQLDPSQLPRGLSSSINLKPQISVDGTVVATGPGMRAGSEPVGQGGFTRYGSQDWDETQDQLIAGQQTALGVSIQGISQTQLQTLKTRMEATKQKLELAQAAPEVQRATILQGLTGDHLTGDLLTATLWGYFAALQSHGAIASAQAQMVDRPALSYGLFHAQVRPNKLYGIVTTGITFQGLNMDIGHLRHTRWVKNDDPSAAINNKPELTSNGKTAAQNRWIAYNKMRGQYSSAMEHAVPEQFWVDKSQCRHTDEQGQIQNPTQADCAQGVSAVKAIAIAQAEGQRIYTINQSNAATALPKLPVGGTVGQEIQSAVMAGKEVTVHERQLNVHGFSGYGYIITDSETGAGAYMIEGRGNGGFLVALFLCAISFIAAVLLIPSAPLLGLFILAWEILNFALWIDAIKNSQNEKDFNRANAGYSIGAVLGLFQPGVAVAELVKWFGLLMALFLTTYL